MTNVNCCCTQKFRQQTQSQHNYNHAKLSNMDSFTMSSTSPAAASAATSTTIASGDLHNNRGIVNGKNTIDHMGAAGASNCKQQFTSKIAANQRRQVELYDVAGKVQFFS